jgi:hypothetical protein
MYICLLLIYFARYGKAADVYSFGIVLYILISGGRCEFKNMCLKINKFDKISNIINHLLIYICFRHPFANTEGKFNMLNVLAGKYDLIERKDIDERLKELCYRMIRLVMRYIYMSI